MEMILLACSSKKELGGLPEIEVSSNISKKLPLALFEKLNISRVHLLASELKGLPTQDLYLPAYQRYTGKVYKYGCIADYFPRQQYFQLVIISALYGVLDGYDLIKKYNVHLNSKLDSQTLQTWWKHQGLSPILEGYIRECAPTKIYDLLPIAYRKTLDPWPPASIKNLVERVPVRLGNELSTRDRGDFLRKLFGC